MRIKLIDASCPEEGLTSGKFLIRVIIIIITDMFSQCLPNLPDSETQPGSLAGLLMPTEKSGQGPGSVVIANTQVILMVRHIWKAP